jgi:predicted transcriptional regulator
VNEKTGAAMPPANGLSEPQEAMLFAIWKLRGIGNKSITEDQLNAQMSNESAEPLPPTLTQLQSQGFVQIAEKGGRKIISITPLGLAILRKLEEDRLQEIK